MRKWSEVTALFDCLLDLKRKAVAVSLLPDAEAYRKAPGLVLKKPLNYCQMVKAASRGTVLKACSADFACRSGARVLAIDPADPKNDRGQNWAALGLYKDEDLSRRIRAGLSYLKEPQYGVSLCPLEKSEAVPDVVVVTGSPYIMMRLTQGYAYHFGLPASVSLIGNQAVCLECSARPCATGDMNLSVLCTGTRHQAGWGDEEMAAGIAGAQFAKVTDGLLQTAPLMEDDRRKRQIEEKMKQKGFSFSLRYGYNYYKDC